MIQYGNALSAADASIDTAQNEAVIAGTVNLSDYDVVIWFSGEESTADETFNTTEQLLVTNYLNQGGNFFASGSEIAWDLHTEGSFLGGQLRTQYVADDAGTYSVSGATGSSFEGLSFSFDNGSQLYDVDFPDVIAPINGATYALNYSTGSTAGIQFDGGDGGPRLVLFGFPFETITDDALRAQVMSRVLEFFDVGTELSDVDVIIDNDFSAPSYTETGTWNTSHGAGFNGGTYRFVPTGSAATAHWQFYTPFAGEGEVFVQYVAASNRASSATYQVDTGNGVETVSIDQTLNSLTWVSLGTFDFTSGTHEIVLNAETSSGGSVVIADAVRVFVPVPVVENADFDGDGDVDGRDFLAWQRGFSSPSPTLNDGDANQDGFVDGDDLAVWQSQYGTPQDVNSLPAAISSGEQELTSDAQLVGPYTYVIAELNPKQPQSGKYQTSESLYKESTFEDYLFSPSDLQTTGMSKLHTPTEEAVSEYLSDHDETNDLEREIDSVFTELGVLYE